MNRRCAASLATRAAGDMLARSSWNFLAMVSTLLFRSACPLVFSISISCASTFPLFTTGVLVIQPEDLPLYESLKQGLIAGNQPRVPVTKRKDLVSA